MTTEERLDKLEDGFHSIDKRQENFETYTRERIDSFENFMRMYIEKTDQVIVEQRDRMDRMDSKMDDIIKEVRSMGRYVNALVITTVVGIASITYTLISFVNSIKP